MNKVCFILIIFVLINLEIYSYRPPKIVGKVCDADTLEEIRGVYLSLGNDMSTLVLSDIKGSFIIDNISFGPRIFVIKASKENYSTEYLTIETKFNEDCMVNIFLKKSETKNSISFKEKIVKRRVNSNFIFMTKLEEESLKKTIDALKILNFRKNDNISIEVDNSEDFEIFEKFIKEAYEKIEKNKSIEKNNKIFYLTNQELRVSPKLKEMILMYENLGIEFVCIEIGKNKNTKVTEFGEKDFFSYYYASDILEIFQIVLDEEEKEFKAEDIKLLEIKYK